MAFPALAPDCANCHTFQRDMLAQCRLQEGTVRVLDDEGHVASQRAPAKSARLDDD
jgi:hypothetical protein